MSQSLHCKYGHIVFSTKNRERTITGDMEGRLFEYMGGIVRGMNGRVVEMNGTMDHVHLLIRESKSVADQEFMSRLKGDSSHWINNTFMGAGFSWQDGYGWFSVSPADVEAGAGYIRGQKEHHKVVDFKDEFRHFLRKYGVEYDERYVWD